MQRKWYAVVIGCLLLFFFFCPGTVSGSAKEGLLLWFQVVLPALLPFMILSSVILQMGFNDSISRVVSPVLMKVFGISQAGCYPVVIGLLSGYPLGAATVAEMVKRDRLSQTEAQYILHFCNNASPMFILQYIGIDCLGLRQPLLLLAVIYLSVWTSAAFERLLRQRGFVKHPSAPLCVRQRQSVIAILDESILHSFTVLTRVGGYIILFSILAGAWQQIRLFPVPFRAVLTGLLEITTGAGQIMQTPLPEQWRMILLTGCTAFGGLSSVAQSASVLDETGLSIRSYLGAKMRQAVIASGYMALLISLFGTDVLH